MPTRTTSKTKKTAPARRKKAAMVDNVQFEESDSAPDPVAVTQQDRTSKRSRFLLVAVAVLALAGLAALAFRNKSLFLAAFVNGQPVTRMELNQRLTERYGTQVLEAMIGERLIKAEAAKKGVAISDAELGSRISEIEGTLNEQMSLDDALKLQGLSRNEFEEQVRIQLLIDKMLANEVSVSAQEVDEFITGNAVALTATDPAQQRVEAEQQIKSNKIAEKFQEWFQTLKDSANVQRFIGE